MIARPPSASRSIRSARPWTVTPASGVSPVDLGRERAPARRPVSRSMLRDPVDRLHQPRRPQGAQHRVDRLVAQAAARRAAAAWPGSQSSCLKPLLEHLVDGGALPRGACGRHRPDRARAARGSPAHRKRTGRPSAGRPRSPRSVSGRCSAGGRGRRAGRPGCGGPGSSSARASRSSRCRAASRRSSPAAAARSARRPSATGCRAAPG